MLNKESANDAYGSKYAKGTLKRQKRQDYIEHNRYNIDKIESHLSPKASVQVPVKISENQSPQAAFQSPKYAYNNIVSKNLHQYDSEIQYVSHSSNGFDMNSPQDNES